MLRTIITKAQEFIKWAEDDMRDKSGPERKRAVVRAMRGAIDIPMMPEWMESIFEPALYGAIVDIVVKWWNALTGHDVGSVPLSDAVISKTEKAVIAELTGAVAEKDLPGAMFSLNPKTGEELTVEQKFDALLKEYVR